MHNTPHYWVNDAKEDEITYINEWSAKHEADILVDYINNTAGKTRDDNKPFALFWSVNPPHPPYQYVPEKYLKNYKNKPLEELLVRKNVDLESHSEELAFHKGATRQRAYLAEEHVRNYYAMVTGVDDQIGRVLKALKAKGLDKNTIVVLTSDHGEMMGSHALMSKNIWYEEALNVPFIIRWPEKIAGGQKEDLLLSTTDIMPTLLNMMGALDSIPTNLDGQDLSSLILTGKGDRPKSALYYYLKQGRPESGHRGIRTLTHTYVITIDDTNIERKFMYDNSNDPSQSINIIGKDALTEKKLHLALLKSLKEKNDPWLEHYQKLNNLDSRVQGMLPEEHF